IKNTSGDEKYVRTGSSLVWKANGKDIKYRGNSKGNLPVSVTVSYYLNGQKLSADEIKGKSGKVQIKFAYTVHQKDSIDGQTISHPYTMISGAVLDNSHFSNISVTNGKNVAQDGSSIVVGMALPGLAENLGLTGRIDIPETVTITADVKDFELDGTYTAAISGLLGNIDKSGISKAESLADQLESGLNELSTASSALAASANALCAGNIDLAEGTQELQDRSTELANGLASLSSGAKTLNGIVQNMSLSLTEDQQNNIKNQAARAVSKDLNDPNSDLSKGLALISSKVKDGLKNNTTIQEQTAKIKNLFENAGESEDKAQAYATAMVNGIIDSSVDQTISAEKDNRLFESIAQNAALSGAEGALDALPNSSQFQALKKATQALEDGTATASASVNGETGETITGGISAINKGAQKLASKSSEYAGYMNTFDKEGIQKLVSSLNDEELKQVANKLKAVIDASSDPVFIGGKASSMAGESRIIFKTDYIGD
ncbi:MAG: hypothetical protein VZQ84_03805, partial [Anaerovoracaceae bacterium]|nr:hypothetical protein [Anaerovoracaceae bacterium]